MPGLVAGTLADDLRTQRVGAEQSVWAMLLSRSDGNQDCLGLGEIGLDFGPGGEMKLHAFVYQPLHSRSSSARRSCSSASFSG